MIGSQFPGGPAITGPTCGSHVTETPNDTAGGIPRRVTRPWYPSKLACGNSRVRSWSRVAGSPGRMTVAHTESNPRTVQARSKMVHEEPGRDPHRYLVRRRVHPILEACCVVGTVYEQIQVRITLRKSNARQQGDRRVVPPQNGEHLVPHECLRHMHLARPEVRHVKRGQHPDPGLLTPLPPVRRAASGCQCPSVSPPSPAPYGTRAQSSSPRRGHTAWQSGPFCR